MEPVFSKTKATLYFLGIIFAVFLVYFFYFRAPNDFPAGTLVNIPEGLGLRKIGTELKNAHIIRSKLLFEAFSILNNGEHHIIPGDYYFESKLPVYVVARRISKGEHNLAPIKVTIPEGFNNIDIASTFSLKLTNFSKEKFLTAAAPKEGYLFPDTYFFLTTDDEETVLKSMGENYEKKITPIRSEITASHHTEKDIVTMASIIEEEAKGDADREIISGILWHRLSIGMPLEVDAAPITYKAKGLPKSPISNPGLLAIKAAIHPLKSPYLYYLHGPDGNVHYAKNFEEHKANKLKYLPK